MTALVVGAVAALGCATVPEENAGLATADWDGAVERARAAADDLGRRLASGLNEGLGNGGPATAIEVCSEIAPAAAHELSRDGVEVRRTSERYRNPRNAPDEWELAGLRLFQQRLAAGQTLGEIHDRDEAGGELRYLRPILVGGHCLQCHGASEVLDAEVRARLGEHYPDDRATGFAAGDLRGAFSVRVDLNPPAEGSSAAPSS